MIAKLLWTGFALFPVLFLLTHRVLYPWLLAIYTVWLAASWWIVTRPESVFADWRGLDEGLVLIGVILCLGSFIVRAIVLLITSRLVDRDEGEADWRPFWIAAGLSAMLWCLWLGMPFVVDIVGARAVIGMAAVIQIALLTGMLAGDGAWVRATSAIAFLALFVLTVLTVSIPARVVDAAGGAAQGQPYCLLVADGDRAHRPASSLLDLTPLVMRARESGTIALSNHAQLHVAEQAPLHWSYIEGRFNARVERPGDKPCRMNVHFARDLKW